MDITLPYVREKEGGRRKGKDWWRGRGKIRFAAVSVNKHTGMTTETDMVSATRKCWAVGEGEERVTRGEDRS